ncbi:porin family protein [Lewinella sp. IMCC34183]|uniref:porin family protein n=1 Tax=Lewinella sp. IMCC34183 TaxID=2248762 RepID=UPI000E27EF06|nr:porin family protein [Lewinella sp. IMCC34183]
MKTQLLALFALLLTGTVAAQTSWGIRVGAGQTDIRSGETFDMLTDRMDAIGTTSFGAFVEVPLTPDLTLRPGLEYSSRGTSVGLTDDVELLGVKLPIGARAKTRFNYIDAPLLLQYTLPTERGVRPYLIAGPTVGYATGGKLTTSAKAIIELNLYSTPVDLDAIRYDRFNVGLIGGAGLKARLGEFSSLFLEARYEHGLSQPYDVPVIKDKVGFQGWNVGAGVSFAL